MIADCPPTKPKIKDVVQILFMHPTYMPLISDWIDEKTWIDTQYRSTSLFWRFI